MLAQIESRGANQHDGDGQQYERDGAAGGRLGEHVDEEERNAEQRGVLHDVATGKARVAEWRKDAHKLG